MKDKVTAIIVAGGSGKRMGTKVPKQFLKLAGKPIIVHTLEKFDRHKEINNIVVVCHKDHIERLKSMGKKARIKKIYRIVPGGKTRQASSYEGVKNCPQGTGYVLIHDAVRPFVTDRVISDVLAAAKKTGASGCTIDVTDTIVEVKDGFIKSIPDRESLKRIQTPQGFKYSVVRAAHEKVRKKGIMDATDDCGLIVLMGNLVATVEGAAMNEKITTGKDMIMVEGLFKKDKS